MNSPYSLSEKQSIRLKRKWDEYSEKVTDSLEIKKQRGHLLVLDGARAIACLAVLLHHTFYHIILPLHWKGIWTPTGKIQVLLAGMLNFGESGVLLFFLLSSFLLFLPFARALLFDGQRPSILRFYIRRCSRILPAYYAAIILMMFFFHPEFLHAANNLKLLRFFTFSMRRSLSEQLNSPFWTMAIEFQFYMLLPVIAWIISLIVPRGTLRWRLTKLIACLLILLGWGILSRWWGQSIDPSATGFPQNILLVLQPFYYGDTGKYYESFAIGMLIATLYIYTQHAPRGKSVQMKIERLSPWMFLIGSLIVIALSTFAFCIRKHSFIVAFNFLDHYTTMLNNLYGQWQALGYSFAYGLYICALLYNNGQIKRPFEWRVLRWIGLFSFSLYMWHFPLLFLFLNILRQQFQGINPITQLVALLAWILFVIFPISMTFYRWIEMPGMRLGELLVKRIKTKKPLDTTPHTPIEDAISTPLNAVLS